MVAGNPGRRLFIAAFAGSAVGGCGFRPVYMKTASGGPGIAQRELAGISVDVIPDRPGQLLRQALQRRFEGASAGAPTKYDLGVSYSIGGEGIAVLPDNTVSRIRFIARGSWTLRAQNPQRSTLATGSARAVDGINIIDEQYFAADLGTEAAQRRLAEQVADQITMQLAAYFRRQAAATG